MPSPDSSDTHAFDTSNFDRELVQSSIVTVQRYSGIKQIDLAEKSGISLPYLNRLIKGKLTNPSQYIYRKVAHGLGANSFNELYKMAQILEKEKPFNRDNFDAELTGASVSSILDHSGLKQTWLSEKSGVSLAYLNQLIKGKAAHVSIDICQKVAQGLGATSFDELYAMADVQEKEKPIRDTSFNKERVQSNIVTVQRYSGINQTDLAKKSGISLTYLNRLLHGKTTNISQDIYLKVAQALGAKSFDELYAMADALEKEKPFNRDNFDADLAGASVSRIFKNSGLKQTWLSEKSGVSLPYLNLLLRGKATNVSIDICQKVAQGLGATSFDELYAMEQAKFAQMPEKKQPADNGIGALVGNLVTQVNAQPAHGTIGEMLNTPIKTLLAKPEHKGKIIATDEKEAAR